MANWGVPDYTDTVSDTEKGALARRVREETGGKGLHQWPHNDRIDRGYPPDKVKEHCVNNKEWQAVRLSMKGKDTHEKLAILKAWWDKAPKTTVGILDIVPYAVECQVGNYLGALRRGGQLDDSNHIRRWR